MDITEFTVLGLKNPLPTDYVFKWDKVFYTAKAGRVTNFPAFLATHAALKMAQLIVTASHGIAKVNDKDLMESTIRSLLVEDNTFSMQKPKTEAEILEDNIKAMNQTIDQPEETEAFGNLNDESKSEEVDKTAEVIDGTIGNTESIPTEEELVAEENRKYLTAMTLPQLRMAAARSGIPTKGLDQNQILEALLKN